MKTETSGCGYTCKCADDLSILGDILAAALVLSNTETALVPCPWVMIRGITVNQPGILRSLGPARPFD